MLIKYLLWATIVFFMVFVFPIIAFYFCKKLLDIIDPGEGVIESFGTVIALALIFLLVLGVLVFFGFLIITLIWSV